MCDELEVVGDNQAYIRQEPLSAGDNLKTRIQKCVLVTCGCAAWLKIIN